MAMPRVLGIDSSLTSTGLCRVDLSDGNDPVIACATVTSKASPDKSTAAMSTRIRSIVARIEAGAEGTDLALIEGPSYGSPNSAHVLSWLWGAVVDMLVINGVQILVVAPAQRMKYATGKGNAAKDVVLAAAIHRWPQVTIEGNDTADALILAAIGCRSLKSPIDDVPKAHWEPVMQKVLGGLR